MEKYIEYLESWLEQELAYRGADGFVVGVSGGVDSAVVAKLLARKFAKQTLGLILPCKSDMQDMVDAKLVLEDAKIAYDVIDLTTAHQELFSQITTYTNNNITEQQRVIDGNMRARLRMTTLFAVAQSKNYLVVGTDNAIEWYTGYFTKFGDGGVDIAPLIHLMKSEVYQMAELLSVPKQIIDKAPSAGLWENQTDESEMGVTYAELENFLSGGTVSDTAQTRINYWHERSHHKRVMPRIPTKFK